MSFSVVFCFIIRRPPTSTRTDTLFSYTTLFRSVGEGHISSLTFRSGILAADGTVTIDPPARLAATPDVTARVGDYLELSFDPAGDIAERVIFPVTEMQANGIEDARFVAFQSEGQTIYYATYTAYSSRGIRSELLETRDFVTFHLTPLKEIGRAHV